MKPYRFWLILFLVLILASVLISGRYCSVWGEPPEIPNSNTWMTNGSVYAIANEGGITYIGGDFTRIGPPTDCGAPISKLTGQALPPHLKINGTVYSVARDGSGGWYIAGDFDRVGGVERNGLAHILSDGTLDTSWKSNVNERVYTLAASGNMVYVGGYFTNIGGKARSHIAALDATSGKTTSWNPGATGPVYALAVNKGVVYAGGSFLNIGGKTRHGIAAVNATTGKVTSWNPQGVNKYGQVYVLKVNGDVVYVGGHFTSIGGQERNNIAALDATTGQVTSWNPNADHPVYALATRGSVVYSGGEFTSIGGQQRSFIAGLDATTGEATPWNPDANGWVQALAESGGVVYAGGEFTSIGGQPRNFIAGLDATTGEATSWNPDASSSVAALAATADTVYAGGWFATIGGQERTHIAALDATTGEPTPWNPNADKAVIALIVNEATVYAGGDFTSIGGQARNHIAALDVTTGEVIPWNPNADHPVRALVASGDVVYAGGGFTDIGGQLRNCIAALDATTGEATPWNPNVSCTSDWCSSPGVSALAVSEGLVYAGGIFTSIGGQERHSIAALDAVTGEATSWNPDAKLWHHYYGEIVGRVLTLATSGDLIYVGGEFTDIGGQDRNDIAAIEATTGRATSWNPSAQRYSYGGHHSEVSSLAVSGGLVYVGGKYGKIGGQDRNDIAAIDATTGEATSWNPSTCCYDDNYYVGVTSVAVGGGAVHVGGVFRSIGGELRSHFAQFGVYPISGTPNRFEFEMSDAGFTSPPQTFTITNQAEMDLVIDSILLTGDDSEEFLLQNDNCSGSVLTPSAICTVEVVFSPRSTGMKSAYLTTSSNIPADWALDVPLKGACGISNVSVTPSSEDFGEVCVGNVNLSTLIISNTGTVDLAIGNLSLVGTDTSHFELRNDRCSRRTLTSSSDCSVELIFWPESAGSKSAILHVPTSDPDMPVVQVPLSGTGVSPYPKITLLSPNGGEVIPSGSPYLIRWRAPSNIPTFRAFYSLDNGATWERITPEVPLRNLSYLWQVPETGGNKRACRVKVVGYDGNGIQVVGSDVSDAPFSIEVVKLLSPNGGEVFQAGDTATIEWRASPEAQIFRLMFSCDDGLTWRFINYGIGVTGTKFTTIIPPTDTGIKSRCLIKVIAYNASGEKLGHDRSDESFTVEAVKLTEPNGGRLPLKSGGPLTITWETHATIKPITEVLLSYTLNGGTIWKPIATLTGGSSSYSWNIPDVATTNTECKVKVVLKDAEGVTRGRDVSDGFFTIEP